MTYHSYGIIQATTYNAYAAIINSLYADTNSGSTVETSADYGYGQGTTVPTVAVGDNVTAAQWTALFSKITAIGTHQGTDVTPIPSSVSAGGLITAYNSYLTTQTLTDVVSLLIANRLKVAVAQKSTVSLYTSGAYGAWTTGLQIQFSINFGSWDNARYFFNTGGAVTFAGTGSGATGEDIFWTSMVSAAMNPLSALAVDWHNSVPYSGAASTVGFYGLTNSGWTQLFERMAVTYAPFPNYSNNNLNIDAILQDAPGVSGIVHFRINLIDNDPTPNAKTANAISYQIGVVKSAGTIPYSGSHTFGFVSFGSISSTGVTPVPLTLTSSPTTLSGKVDGGAGTATTASVTITAAGGTAPYTYDWTNQAGTVTFSNQHQVTSGASSTTMSMALTSGQIASGTALCTVTDNAAASANVPVNWSLNSNPANTFGT
jgi:hypothetical protein